MSDKLELDLSTLDEGLAPESVEKVIDPRSKIEYEVIVLFKSAKVRNSQVDRRHIGKHPHGPTD